MWRRISVPNFKLVRTRLFAPLAEFWLAFCGNDISGPMQRDTPVTTTPSTGLGVPYTPLFCTLQPWYCALPMDLRAARLRLCISRDPERARRTKYLVRTVESRPLVVVVAYALRELNGVDMRLVKENSQLEKIGPY